MDKTERKYLREELGVSEKMIKTLEEWEEKGVLDVEPSPDLVERTMEKCRPKLEKIAAEARSKKRMKTSCFSRLYGNIKRQIYHYLFK